MARARARRDAGANYGIYGPAFELLEHAPREPGSEEYLDSEKYELRHWDLDRADSLARVHRARERDPRATTRRCSRDWSLRVPRRRQRRSSSATRKTTTDRQRACSSSSTSIRTTRSRAGSTLDLAALGIDADEPYQVHDLLTDARYHLARRAQLRRARSGTRCRRTSSACAGACAPSATSTTSCSERSWIRRRARRADTHAADAVAERPALVQGRGHLPAARQGVLRLERRRHRRLPRA